MVDWWTFSITAITGIVLFLFGIEHFGRQIQKIVGDRFRKTVSKIADNKWLGAIMGFFTTSLVQSSTAVTVITVSLVGSGIISFAQSIGIIIGANIGTTITSQLIAFNLTSIAPIFIIGGFLINIFGRQYKFLGKPIFYFGFVFFSLMLISNAVSPLKNDPDIINWISSFSNIYLALAIGFLVTIIVQSSSVTTGLVVILTSAGLIGLQQGIPLLLGANIGTTITAVIAASVMNREAKKAALAHVLFNVIGVILILPFLSPFTEIVSTLGSTEAKQLANAHLIFNLSIALIFLLFLSPFKKLIELIIKRKKR